MPRKRDIQHRLTAIAILGGQCAECGESDKSVLTFDHKYGRIAGDKLSGTKLSREISLGRYSTEGLQLLCANCHYRKSYPIDLEVWGEYFVN